MSCSCSNSPCSCSPCQPANTVYQGTSTDPGSATSLRHVLGLDSSFCQRRLLPGDGGYLVARATGSGGWLIDFTTEPVIPLSNITAAQSQTFGQFIVQGSDDIMRTLTGPALANLYPRTNAAGQITFETLPNATVPDPLVVNDLTVVTNAQIADLQITGTITATGLATGTLTNIVGIDGSNNIIKGTIATSGSQCAAFYESSASPSTSQPNYTVAPGNILTIGNLLFDSSTVAGNVPTLFTSSPTRLTCAVAGTYVIDFGGFVSYTAGNSGSPAIQLFVNGVNVNNGYAVPGTNAGTIHHLSGNNMRRFNVNDFVELYLAAGSLTSARTQAVRCNLTRLGA